MPDFVTLLLLISVFSMIPCQVSGAEGFFEQGLSDLHTRHYDKAIEAFTKAIAENPNRAEVYNNRGIAWCNRGNYERAMTDFNRALELNPRSAEIFSNRGTIWFYMEKYDLAINDYDKALGIDPLYAKAYTNRGAAWYCKGNFDLAISDYHRALEIDPACVETRSQLAWISDSASGTPEKGDFDTSKSRLQLKPKTGPPPVMYIPFAGERSPGGVQNSHKEKTLIQPDTKAAEAKTGGHQVPPVANKKSKPRQPALPERKTELSFSKSVPKTVYSVQVGAFFSKTNAEELMALMKNKGYEARLLSFHKGQKDVLYTVSIGEFMDRREAKKKAGEFTEKEKRPSFVRPIKEL
jgi:tetratricopeptide (TPR) repeat protein